MFEQDRAQVTVGQWLRAKDNRKQRKSTQSSAPGSNLTQDKSTHRFQRHSTKTSSTNWGNAAYQIIHVCPRTQLAKRTSGDLLQKSTLVQYCTGMGILSLLIGFYAFRIYNNYHVKLRWDLLTNILIFHNTCQ